MRLLVVVSMYPHPGHPYSGIFNRNCVEAAQRQGHELVVLAPRPWVPLFLKFHPRWQAYSQIPRFSNQGGIEVHRPDLVQVPRFATTFQRNQGAFLQMRSVAKKLHRENNFDVVFSFDLGGAGGLAWRLGNYLGVPSTGWAFGLDVRIPADSTDADELRQMLNKLDLVFYQSSELRDCAESYLRGDSLDRDRHLLLPHGIPHLDVPDDDLRAAKRKELGVADDQILALFLSRVVKGKGVDELLVAFEHAAKQNPNLVCIAVGETPGFDDSEELKRSIQAKGLEERFRLLPACRPEQVHEFHAAADIFVFPSKSEGMPNALLEAMALGTPSIVFDIPPIRDIVALGPGLRTVPCFDADEFGKALTELAGSAELRSQLSTAGRAVVNEHFDIDQNMARALQHTSELIATPSTTSSC